MGQNTKSCVRTSLPHNTPHIQSCCKYIGNFIFVVHVFVVTIYTKYLVVVETYAIISIMPIGI